jgi:hypothetical protein
MRRETYVGWCVGKEINSSGRGILRAQFWYFREETLKNKERK